MTKRTGEVRLAVLVSGRGSNLGAILRAIDRGYITNAAVAVVISNRPDVRALRVAESHGVRTEILVPRKEETRETYDARLLTALNAAGVDAKDGVVLLAGFMRLLSPGFVAFYRNRILNIHPSLLPAFPGLEAQKQALDHGAKVSGCTVHFVVPEVDAGPIILQRSVEVKEGDTVEALSARILRQEHLLYPRAVKLFVEGKLRITGKRVVIGD
ncbi:MAG: phosphoribosylglycinamide formyltransferase [Thaumarchaeota archaeon]|nr:phosphoribosylglycinamide formyltransferase [Nitrososphaerota archaeon]